MRIYTVETIREPPTFSPDKYLATSSEHSVMALLEISFKRLSVWGWLFHSVWGSKKIILSLT